MRIAACAFHATWHADWDALAATMEAWVADAQADLLVFPEYAGIAAALIGAPVPEPDAQVWTGRMCDAAQDWADLHSALAQRHGKHILAGSIAVRTGDKIVNRASLCLPDGQVVHQDKAILTPYERDAMCMSAGDGLHLFDTVFGKIGVLICYDSEFPLLARELVAAGAAMILVPSCTDLPAGQTRVRQSCRARAIEGQCIVVQAPLIGPVPECDIVDGSTGRVGVFCPPDHGWPATGIIAQGDVDQPGWIVAEIDLDHRIAAQATAQVGNVHHWPEQASFTSVRHVSLHRGT